MNLFELKYNVANDMKLNWCGIETVRTFNVKNVSLTVYVRIFHKVVFFQKKKKPMKYDLVRTVI